MPDNAPAFNPSRYQPLRDSSRRVKDLETGKTISRRAYDDLRRTAKVIRHRDRAFRNSVKKGVQASRERALELRRLARELNDLADEIERIGEERGYDEYTPAEIGYDEYTPARLKELAAQRKENIREFQRAGRKRTQTLRRRRASFREQVKKLGVIDSEEKRNRLRDLLEQFGFRNNVPHWVPPGFSDPNKRPKWWRSNNVPKRYRVAT